MKSRLHQLSALGQSVWIDYLSRDLIESGALAKAIAEDAVVGVTSNPSIFQKALAQGHAYDDQIAASNVGDAESVFLSLALRRRRGRLRSTPAGLGANTSTRRLRFDRGRAHPRRRHRGDDRASNAVP